MILNIYEAADILYPYFPFLLQYLTNSQWESGHASGTDGVNLYPYNGMKYSKCRRIEAIKDPVTKYPNI
jgi:hypothetical protein